MLEHASNRPGSLYGRDPGASIGGQYQGVGAHLELHGRQIEN